jgi:hypothetical protein
MSMLDASGWDLEDSYDPIALPDGTECEIRILDVGCGKDKNGLEFLMPRFEVVDQPLAKDFSHFFHLPTDDIDPETGKPKMDKKTLNRVKRALYKFFLCFDIEPGVFDPEDEWPGMQGWAILSYSNDPQYGEQNRVKQFLQKKS